MNNILEEIINKKDLYSKEVINKNYKYYIKTKNELEKLNIEQYSVLDLLKIITDNKYSKYIRIYKELFNDYKTELLYKSYGHGINHNIRVTLYAVIISIYEEISIDDFKLVIEACKYHDIGRINDLLDEKHGLRSAEMIDFLKDKYAEEEMNILRTIITCHSLNDKEHDKIAKKNGVKNIKRSKKLLDILKDSDALDRVRLNYPLIRIDYLRTDISKKIVLFSFLTYFNYEKILNIK